VWKSLAASTKALKKEEIRKRLAGRSGFSIVPNRENGSDAASVSA
jgi:hypothetical protein